METDGISEIALPVGTVLRIVQDALNAQWLNVPHQVTDMDYDRANETVHFDLEGAAAPSATPAVETVRLVEPASSPAAGERQNGHGAALPRQFVVERARRDGPAGGEATRKPTAEDKRAIRDMVTAQRTRTAASIAEELGLPVKSVAYFVTVFRKELAEDAGGMPNKRLDTLSRRSRSRLAARVRKGFPSDHPRQALPDQLARLAEPPRLTPRRETSPAPARPDVPPPPASCYPR